MSLIPERYRLKLRHSSRGSNRGDDATKLAADAKLLASNLVAIERWINTLPWLSFQLVTLGGNQTLTTTYTAVSNFTVSVVPARPPTVVVAVLICNFEHTAAGGGNARGRLTLDGTAFTPVASLNESAVEGTVAQVYLTTLSADQSYEFAVEVSKSGVGGTVRIAQTHSTLLVGAIG